MSLDVSVYNEGAGGTVWSGCLGGRYRDCAAMIAAEDILWPSDADKRFKGDAVAVWIIDSLSRYRDDTVGFDLACEEMGVDGRVLLRFLCELLAELVYGDETTEVEFLY